VLYCAIWGFFPNIFHKLMLKIRPFDSPNNAHFGLGFIQKYMARSVNYIIIFVGDKQIEF
jgi:hypothetical protein